MNTENIAMSSHGSDENVNNGTALDGAVVAQPGYGIEQQNTASTGSAVEAAGMDDAQVEDTITHYEAWRYTLHTDYLRLAKKVKVRTKKPKHPVLGEAQLECFTKSALTNTEKAETVDLPLYKNDMSIFPAKSTIRVFGQPGYNSKGQTDGSQLMLYVVKNDRGTSVTVEAINGPMENGKTYVPAIPAGTKLRCMASALSESDLKVASSNFIPTWKQAFLQKKACAITNNECGILDKKKTEAIVRACDEILGGRLHDQFIVEPIQGGAGTSLNMNANEVIANRAIELLGGKKGDYDIVNPNDDVNCGQSTNDVIPTAGKLTALKLLDHTRRELMDLHEALMQKGAEFDSVIKMGRTQMQDAVPIRLGQEFKAYASAIMRDVNRMDKAKDEMRSLNLGGTAIGTSLNANLQYVQRVVPTLESITGLGLVQAYDLIDATQNLDAFVAVSGAVKACAVTLSKIANDLRLLSSGPYCGFGEINLPARQAGSSIMPGKINPVIPEVVNQVAFNIIGNDVTITMAAEAGQLELNAFEPIVFYCLFQSIDTLGFAVNTFVHNCIEGITVNEARCRSMVDRSVSVITALSPYIGYEKCAEIAKEAMKSGRPLRELLVERGLLTEAQLDRLLDPFVLTGPGRVDKNKIKEK